MFECDDIYAHSKTLDITYVELNLKHSKQRPSNYFSLHIKAFVLGESKCLFKIRK